MTAKRMKRYLWIALCLCLVFQVTYYLVHSDMKEGAHSDGNSHIIGRDIVPEQGRKASTTTTSQTGELLFKLDPEPTLLKEEERGGNLQLTIQSLNKRMDQLENDLQQSNDVWNAWRLQYDYNIGTINDHKATTPIIFPETKFTPHVREVLSVIEKKQLKQKESPYYPMAGCGWSYRLVVDSPYTRPSRIECRKVQMEDPWCPLFRKMFRNATRILPYNVTLGISTSDADWPEGRIATWGQCISSSSPNGSFAMNNFQDGLAQVGLGGDEKNLTTPEVGWVFPASLPWQTRQKIPVFRGSPRMYRATDGKFTRNPNCPARMTDSVHHRVRAAMFSLEHSDLLDAAVSPQPDAACARYNATNGLAELWRWGKYAHPTSLRPPIRIPPAEYYTNYQTAVVLGGFGAAFRTNRHLAAGQAVVLQRYPFEEWYIPYMTPYVHYIPLKEDLSDMMSVMEWVRDHPKEVKAIAKNGKEFYHKYLSFPNNVEHWYELLWRLSLLLQGNGPEWLKRADIETVWKEKQPLLFELTLNGEYQKTIKIHETDGTIFPKTESESNKQALKAQLYQSLQNPTKENSIYVK